MSFGVRTIDIEYHKKIAIKDFVNGCPNSIFVRKYF